MKLIRKLTKEETKATRRAYRILEDVFYATRAAEHCSLFYILYFLVNFKNRDELLYDLRNEEKLLREAFLYGGAFACGKEASHIVDRVFSKLTRDWVEKWAEKVWDIPELDNCIIFNISRVYQCFYGGEMTRFSALIDDVNGHPIVFVHPRDLPEVTECIADFLDVPWLNPTEEQREMARRLAAFFIARNGPKFFYAEVIPTTISEMFEYFYFQMFCKGFTKPKPLLEYCDYAFKNYRWSAAYGGNAWATISHIVKQYNDFTPSMFIDLCWDLEHNTGVWLNKFKAHVDILKTVLDAKLEGDFSELYPRAVKLMPKIRRYRLYLPGVFERERWLGTWNVWIKGSKVGGLASLFARSRRRRFEEQPYRISDPDVERWVEFQKRNYKYINRLLGV